MSSGISCFKKGMKKILDFFIERTKVFCRLTEINSVSGNATFVLSMLYSCFFIQ